MDWQLTDHGFQWSQRFDQHVKERACSPDPTEFATLDAHAGSRTAVQPRITSARRRTWPATTAEGGASKPPAGTPDASSI